MKKTEYRNQALKILPWVCAKCGRDFSGKNLRELTVHHKDHDHDNNPPPIGEKCRLKKSPPLLTNHIAVQSFQLYTTLLT
jgi:hypothetical protein